MAALPRGPWPHLSQTPHYLGSRPRVCRVTRIEASREPSFKELVLNSAIRAAGLALALFSAAFCVNAQTQEDQPKITEETPYVPSPKVVVDTMLRMAGVRANDFLIDLGSGDGRIIITAVLEYKAQGFGVDYDPRLVRLANENARKAGVEARAKFLEQNVFKTDLGKASVVTMYLLPEYNAVLKPTLFGLKPGTRIVSHDYGIDDWEPDAQEKIAVPDKPVGADKASWIYYWMVPAKVAGKWRSRVNLGKGSVAMELDLKQKYQKVEGTAKIGDRMLPIENAALKGTALAFDVMEGGRTLHVEATLAGKQFTGRIAVNGKRQAWRAVKLEAPKA